MPTNNAMKFIDRIAWSHTLSHNNYLSQSDNGSGRFVIYASVHWSGLCDNLRDQSSTEEMKSDILSPNRRRKTRPVFATMITGA